MSNRNAALAGLTATLVFWLALAGFAAVRPEYSHAHKAVSELGIIGAPHALAWNLLGFIVPGILLALCGAGVAQAVDGSRKVLWYLLVLVGVGFAFTGVFPAVMKDGEPLLQAPLTIMHLGASLLSSLLWMLALLVLPWRTWRNPAWRAFTGVAVGLAVIGVGGTFVNMTLLPMLVPQLQYTPGITQRIGFALCFGCYCVLAMQLWRGRELTMNTAVGYN